MALRATISATTAIATAKNSNIEPPGASLPILMLVASHLSVVSGGKSSSRRAGEGSLFQIDTEWLAFGRERTRTHFIQRTQHPSLPAPCLVREADDQAVRRRNRRGRPYLARDCDFVAVRIERAHGGKGARGRTADAGITMHDQWRAPIPAAYEIQHLLDMDLGRRDKAFDGF